MKIFRLFIFLLTTILLSVIIILPLPNAEGLNITFVDSGGSRSSIAVSQLLITQTSTGQSLGEAKDNVVVFSIAYTNTNGGIVKNITDLVQSGFYKMVSQSGLEIWEGRIANNQPSSLFTIYLTASECISASYSIYNNVLQFGPPTNSTSGSSTVAQIEQTVSSTSSWIVAGYRSILPNAFSSNQGTLRDTRVGVSGCTPTVGIGDNTNSLNVYNSINLSPTDNWKVSSVELRPDPPQVSVDVANSVHGYSSTITTIQPNDLIVMFLSHDPSGCTDPNSNFACVSISDTRGLSWNKRGYQRSFAGGVWDEYEYYAIDSIAGFINVTITYTGGSGNADTDLIAIKSYNTKTPFVTLTQVTDISGQPPGFAPTIRNTGFGSSSSVVGSCCTEQIRGFVMFIGAENLVSNTVWTPGTGYALTSPCSINANLCSESRVGTIPISNLPISMSTSVASSWAILGDSVCDVSGCVIPLRVNTINGAFFIGSLFILVAICSSLNMIGVFGRPPNRFLHIEADKNRNAIVTIILFLVLGVIVMLFSGLFP